MLYNNLLLFLVAIFLFSMDTAPDVPMFPGWLSLLFFILSVVGFDRLCARMFNMRATLSSSGYFAAEKRLSIGALLFFGVGALYLSEAKYYLSVLSLGERMPALVNIGGLVLFLFFFSIMWRRARRNYQHVFGRSYSSVGFILSNIKANLPIVLPWVLLSLVYDLLVLIPFAPLQSVLESQWGDLGFFFLFVLFVVLLFPPLVRRLWGCKPLPEGELKSRLESFCKTQDFTAKLYLWPLFEGKVLTAGVMGLLPGVRYVMLTPAIIQTMTMEELESVMAHEIGHVKRYHLLLYLFIIMGFSLVAGLFAIPATMALLSLDPVVNLVISAEFNLAAFQNIVTGVLLLTVMVLYFRFLFGYFMRNFERQADLHVIKAVGTGRWLISAFEKISMMSGNIRDEKNWHHFGIGERIDCLVEAEKRPETIRQHDRKVLYSLIGFVLVLAGSVTWILQAPTDELGLVYQQKYQEAIIVSQIEKEPKRALWHFQMGNLMLDRKMEREALAAFERAFTLEPANPEVMNNLAWLLLTSEDLTLRDPLHALTLARSAATIKPHGHILDTLARAYWANGFLEEALTTQKQAAFADPLHSSYYQEQVELYMSKTYQESLRQHQASQENG